jgi:hypothetical protein
MEIMAQMKINIKPKEVKKESKRLGTITYGAVFSGYIDGFGNGIFLLTGEGVFKLDREPYPFNSVLVDSPNISEGWDIKVDDYKELKSTLTIENG